MLRRTAEYKFRPNGKGGPGGNAQEHQKANITYLKTEVEILITLYVAVATTMNIDKWFIIVYINKSSLNMRFVQVISLEHWQMVHIGSKGPSVPVSIDKWLT